MCIRRIELFFTFIFQVVHRMVEHRARFCVELCEFLCNPVYKLIIKFERRTNRLLHDASLSKKVLLFEAVLYEAQSTYCKNSTSSKYFL